MVNNIEENPYHIQILLFDKPRTSKTYYFKLHIEV
jgi:hypothetical protein